MAGTIVVVPCFNEAKRLDAAQFRDFSAHARDVKIRFIDDGSTDGTGDVLGELAAHGAGVFDFHRLPRNEGKAEAVRQGLLIALAEQPEFVGYWDADLATPLETIYTFRDVLQERNQIEMVFGSRVKLLGRRIERSETRHYLGRIFATAVSLMLRLPVYDTQCGAKLFRVTPTLPCIFENRFQTRWFFDVEVLARLIALSEQDGSLREVEDAVYELPLPRWVNAEASKVGIGTYSRAGFDLLRIFLHYDLHRRILRIERRRDA